MPAIYKAVGATAIQMFDAPPDLTFEKVQELLKGLKDFDPTLPYVINLKQATDKLRQDMPLQRRLGNYKTEFVQSQAYSACGRAQRQEPDLKFASRSMMALVPHCSDSENTAKWMDAMKSLTTEKNLQKLAAFCDGEQVAFYSMAPKRTALLLSS